jgi:pSer/pThr/pTyr-binding forkhead associated (FHA) protein
MSANCPHCGTTLTNDEIQKLSTPFSLCPHCQAPIEPSSLASSATAEDALPRVIKYGLEVLDGNEPGKIYAIDKARVIIGRKDCDIRLSDPEISRQHAAVLLEGNEAKLEDLKSANGTYVEGLKIEQTSLKPGSIFRLGTHQLVFMVIEETS